MKLTQISGSHYVLDGVHIVYSDGGYGSGWHVLDETKAFPDYKDSFLEVVEQVIRSGQHMPLMPKPAGLKRG